MTGLLRPDRSQFGFATAYSDIELDALAYIANFDFARHRFGWSRRARTRRRRSSWSATTSRSKLEK